MILGNVLLRTDLFCCRNSLLPVDAVKLSFICDLYYLEGLFPSTIGCFETLLIILNLMTTIKIDIRAMSLSRSLTSHIKCLERAVNA